jgi:hypothetical protein
VPTVCSDPETVVTEGKPLLVVLFDDLFKYFSVEAHTSQARTGQQLVNP